MATKRQIINDAFTEIGLASYTFDLTPEEYADLLRKLNTLAAQWDGQGIRVGYSFAAGIDDESGVPDTAQACFAMHLGIRVAPSFGKVIAPETKQAAMVAFNAMLTARRSMPEVPISSRLPVGTGTKTGVLEQQYFNTGNEVPGLNRGPAEY